MIEPQFPGIAHHAQHHRLARRAFAVGHRLPAVVIEIPQALETAHHRRTVLTLVLMHLGPSLIRCQQDGQNGEQTTQQLAHRTATNP